MGTFQDLFLINYEGFVSLIIEMETSSVLRRTWCICCLSSITWHAAAAHLFSLATDTTVTSLHTSQVFINLKWFCSLFAEVLYARPTGWPLSPSGLIRYEGTLESLTLIALHLNQSLVTLPVMHLWLGLAQSPTRYLQPKSGSFLKVEISFKLATTCSVSSGTVLSSRCILNSQVRVIYVQVVYVY